MSKPDVSVVGGGLAGLSAAIFVARAGCRVKLFERSRSLGGRARGVERQGATWNLGPHAILEGGQAHALLTELGIALGGKRAEARGALASGRQAARVVVGRTDRDQPA